LRKLADAGADFAIIGGGFIGSEIAAALAMQGHQVTMLFPETGICNRVFPPAMSEFVTSYYRTRGVTVLPGQTVSDLKADGTKLLLTTTGGQKLTVGGVVAGLGIELNLDLASQAGLAIDNGVVVDELLRADGREIFAAGDIASFYNPALEKRLRVEHEDNAVTMGRQAGRNMAGAGEPYYHLPFFYSDLFDLGYEAVGELDSRMQTFADWREPYREGVVYYLEEGRVRGVLLWNVWDQVDAARRLISEPGPFKAEDLKGRLPA
jgi:NADPH-dependent 2,4-dienoyl-CoA reductase/sulfur reductase-like enzyme